MRRFFVISVVLARGEWQLSEFFVFELVEFLDESVKVWDALGGVLGVGGCADVTNKFIVGIYADI